MGIYETALNIFNRKGALANRFSLGLRQAGNQHKQKQDL